MIFLNDFFEHLRFFTIAAKRRGGVGQFRLGSMDAVVEVGEKKVEFRAQYLTRREDGSVTYSMTFENESPGFVGWLPYFNKRWPEATDKLAFKERVAKAGLPTPLWSVGEVSSELGAYLIKPKKGTFGEGMRGPFAGESAADAKLDAGEFAERFFLGQIGKAWYWNDRVVALDLQDLPAVVGDGIASVGELVKRRSLSANVTDRSDFCRYRDFHWTDIPRRGEKVVTDFRYGSLCYPFRHSSLNRYDELKDGPIVERLNRWGPLFCSFVPEAIRNQTLYSVDFLIPGDGGIRLLEMNCNPTVPPEAYEVIFASLFGEAATETQAPPVLAERPIAAPSPLPATLPPPTPPVPMATQPQPASLGRSNGWQAPTA